MSSCAWEIHSLNGGLGEYRRTWDTLNDQLYQGHPYNDSRFVDAMLKRFGDRHEQLCVHRRGNVVDGLIILRARRSGVWSQFAPAQAQAAPVLVTDRSLIDDLFLALPRSTMAVELMRQDPEYAPTGLLNEARAARMIECDLTINVRLDDSFENYWAERSRGLAQNIRRYYRRAVTEFGAVTVRVVDTPDAMRGAVARYGTLESSGWKGVAGTAIHASNVQGRFYADVMVRFAATGQSKVYELWLGSSLAASRLVIHGGRMAVALKTSYDESLSRFAPGRLLLHEFLERSFADPTLNVLEFYTDASPDQIAWASATRRMAHVTVFRNAWLATAYDHARRLKRPRVADGVAVADGGRGRSPGVAQA